MTARRESIAEIRERLLRWYDGHGRDLPWRCEHRPYAIYISEIMLQQTQVATVLPYYHRWMERLPDFGAVAEASDETLLKLWEGLGYYSRVRNIHKAARMIVREFGGELPRDHAAVLSLPGVGPYTAGALMSLAFNEDYPLVDGNVERVLARLFNIASPVKETPTRKGIWKLAQDLLPRGEARRFNQALMDLGATICVPKTPHCNRCPISMNCEAFRLGVVEQRPVRGARKGTRPIEVAVGILLRDGDVFIQKRPENGLMGGLWEFPGGKLQPEEPPDDALIREFREELGVTIRRLDRIGLFRHAYTSFRVALYAYFCELEDPRAEPSPTTAVDGRWVSLWDLRLVLFGTGDGCRGAGRGHQMGGSPAPNLTHQGRGSQHARTLALHREVGKP